MIKVIEHLGSERGKGGFIVQRPNVYPGRSWPSFLVWHGPDSAYAKEYAKASWWTVGPDSIRFATIFPTEAEAWAVVMAILLLGDVESQAS